MIEPTLEFLSNDGGEWEGLGDAGIETFRDDLYASCAREAGQNSRDAARQLPVRMTFDVLEIGSDEFPALSKFKEAVQACLKTATQEKEVDFFHNAEDILNRPTIKVLRIADYNTTGLVGPPGSEKSPFNALLKGTGVSDKGLETSGGSFGIGKNASFAISDLQTVFYSTVYLGPNEEKAFAAQGKVRMVSHEDAAGSKKRATGYWGNPKGFLGVNKHSLAPAWMLRSELGTTIFVLGFREESSWSQHIAYSLIANFFCAVQREEMVFEVDDGAIKINANTIGNLFNHSGIRTAAANAGQTELLDFSFNLFQCLTSPNSVVKNIDVPGLGTMDVRILVDESYPKRVGIVRNGMLITSSLQYFGDRLERFSNSRPFIALAEPSTAAASKLLKSLENPQHNNFSAPRISNPGKRSNADKAMKKLARELRRTIRENTALDETDEVTIDELSRFFADRASGSIAPGKFTEPDPETFVYEPPKRRRQQTQQTSAKPGTTGGASKVRNGGGGGAISAGGGSGSGSGGTGQRAEESPTIKLSDFRNLLVEDKLPIRRRLWFTPTASGRASIELQATGMHAAEPLKIVNSDQGQVVEGILVIDLAAGTRTQVDVEFDAQYAGPIEVLASLLGDSGEKIP